MRFVWVLSVVLFVGASGRCAEPPCCEPPRQCFFERVCPAGGCNPYGGGVLHWWQRRCFSWCFGPDDYCRKPLPKVCRPACPCEPCRGSGEIYYHFDVHSGSSELSR